MLRGFPQGGHPGRVGSWRSEQRLVSHLPSPSPPETQQHCNTYLRVLIATQETGLVGADFSGSSAPSPWHADAVGGAHPVPSAASGKQKAYASQAGPPVGSD